MFELHDSAAGLSHRTKIKEVVQSTLTPFYRATEYPFGSMCMHTNIKLQDYLNISFLLKKNKKTKTFHTITVLQPIIITWQEKQ